jgi:hypothetical protein
LECAVWVERLYPVRSLRADPLHKIAPIPYVVRFMALLNNKISININLHLFCRAFAVFCYQINNGSPVGINCTFTNKYSIVLRSGYHTI